MTEQSLEERIGILERNQLKYSDTTDSNKKVLEKQSQIVTDLILRVSALEKLLLDNNLVSKDAYETALQEVAQKYTNLIKQSIDQFVKPKDEASDERADNGTVAQ
jgi:hypothetical protein